MDASTCVVVQGFIACIGVSCLLCTEDYFKLCIDKFVCLCFSFHLIPL